MQRCQQQRDQGTEFGINGRLRDEMCDKMLKRGELHHHKKGFINVKGGSGFHHSGSLKPE